MKGMETHLQGAGGAETNQEHYAKANKSASTQGTWFTCQAENQTRGLKNKSCASVMLIEDEGFEVLFKNILVYIHSDIFNSFGTHLLFHSQVIFISLTTAIKSNF